MAGYSEATLRLVPAVMGGAGVWLSYLVARRVYGTPAGLLAASAVAISAPYWTYAMQGRYYSALACLVLAGLICVLRYAESPTRGRFAVALAVGLVGTLFHVYAALVLGLLAVAVALATRKTPRIRPTWPTIAMAIACVGTFAVLRGTVFANPWSGLSGLGMNFAHLQPYYLLQYSRFLWSEFGALYPLAFASPAIGWHLLRDRRDAVILLSLGYLGGLFAVSFLVMFYAERYLAFILPLLLVLSVGTLAAVIGRAFSERVARIGAYAVAAVLVAGSMRSLVPLPDTLSMDDPYSPEPDFRSAYAAIREDAQGRDGWCVVSAYPAMDSIYLGRSDGYAYIDETGLGISPETSHYVREGRSVFTGAPVLGSYSDIAALPCSDRYMLVDGLSAARLSQAGSDILPIVARDWRVVGEWRDPPYFTRVYADR